MRVISRATVLAAIPLFLLGISACSSSGTDGGGSGASPSAAGGTPSEDDLQDAFINYAQCMRDEGIDMPDPEVNGSSGIVTVPGGEEGGSFDQEAFETADKKCAAEHLPDGGEISAEDEAAFQEDMLKFAQCMRENGIDMPDPTSDGRMDFPDITGPDAEETFTKAQTACEGLLGGGTSIATSGKDD